MSNVNNLIKVIKEGKAKIQIPMTVFYNPVQEFNRDLSVLVLRTYLKYNVWHHRSEEKHVRGRGGMMILDALSASGLRSIRYAKELGHSGSIVKKIVANDLSQAAVNLIKENIELNKVEDKVVSSLSDAANLMHTSSVSFDTRFHVIDLDPFGTGAQFFDAAVSSIGEAGLLMVTCTDTAVLCGNSSESCFARYGSMSLRGEFCHEAALRIILRSLESHASVYGRYIKPLICISVDFYVRLFIQVFTQQSETKKSASKLSQVYLCKQCKTPNLVPLGSHEIKSDPKKAESKNDAVKYNFKAGEFNIDGRCNICEGSYSLGGPIWSDPMHDTKFLDLLKQELALSETEQEFATFRRLQGIVYLCSEELGLPLFHSIDTISSTLRMKMPRAKNILSALLNSGYRISGTHTNRNGFKTDAPNSVVWDIFCQAATMQQLTTVDPLALKIMNRPRNKIYDFTYNTRIATESQKLSLLRYQVNPTKEWGPKTRPGGKDSELNERLTSSAEECKSTSEGEAKRRKLVETHDNNRS